MRQLPQSNEVAVVVDITRGENEPNLITGNAVGAAMPVGIPV